VTLAPPILAEELLSARYRFMVEKSVMSEQMSDGRAIPTLQCFDMRYADLLCPEDDERLWNLKALTQTRAGLGSCQ